MRVSHAFVTYRLVGGLFWEICMGCDHHSCWTWMDSAWMWFRMWFGCDFRCEDLRTDSAWMWPWMWFSPANFSLILWSCESSEWFYDMHGERARCARRIFDMNFTYMTSITSRFCMDVTPDVKMLQSPAISAWMWTSSPNSMAVLCSYMYESSSPSLTLSGTF